ncbi:MAG: hypothetical protein H5U03_00160 [Clostridia bacterium]|nr:hypothetical protein [Clostridia bacterium]
MGKKIWVRPYLEGYGLLVRWDDERKEVIVDSIRFKPDYIEDGKAYKDKDFLDNILAAMGVITPSGASPKIEDVLRGSDIWNKIEDAASSVKKWVIDNIWHPIEDWFNGAVTGAGEIVEGIIGLPSRLWSYIRRVGYAFDWLWEKARKYAESVSDWVYNTLFDWAWRTVEWVTEKAATLDDFIYYYLGKVKWLATEAWDAIVEFVVNPIETIAILVIKGFSWWIEPVADLLESYIDDHWEDEI